MKLKFKILNGKVISIIILTLIFVVLKLTWLVDWSWFIILAFPSWLVLFFPSDD